MTNKKKTKRVNDNLKGQTMPRRFDSFHTIRLMYKLRLIDNHIAFVQIRSQAQPTTVITQLKTRFKSSLADFSRSIINGEELQVRDPRWWSCCCEFPF